MMANTRMLPQKLVFIDVETTGMNPVRDRVIDIGIIRVEEGAVVSEYNQLINPGMTYSPYIQDLTGISPRSLEDAPLFEDIAHEVSALLQDAVFVAHNVRFDHSFIRNEFKRLDITFSPRQLCTARLSRKLYTRFRRHNLSALIERFGFTCENRHRAFDDAHVLWQFYQHIQQDFSRDVIERAIASVQKRPTLPPDLDSAVIDTLPETSGIYFFYDAAGTLLYIGKSTNIRNRVLSHLSGDYLSAKQLAMVKQIARIEFEVTAGEIGALLRESYLIKNRMPIYNRQLRRNKKMIVAKKYTTQKGYDTVTLETLTGINAQDIDSVMGVFPSKKRAQDFLRYLQEKYSLCEKLLAQDASRGSCFAYHLGACKGACMQKESSAHYNIRFLLAFAENRIKPWYFDEPVSLVEKNTDARLIETFVIDKWCLIKQVAPDSRQSSVPFEPVFDFDMYKILVRGIKKIDGKRIIMQSGQRIS